MDKKINKPEQENKNISINLIYFGLQHLVWVIDKLGYEEMIDWRNQMCKWQIELEKKYSWIGKDIRSWNVTEKKKGGKND